MDACLGSRCIVARRAPAPNRPGWDDLVGSIGAIRFLTRAWKSFHKTLIFTIPRPVSTIISGDYGEWGIYIGVELGEPRHGLGLGEGKTDD